MRSFKIQVPADVFCLITVIQRLGFRPGALKAAKIEDQRIDLWFESFRGPIKRATARLVKGLSGCHENTPRRVYLDLKVQDSGGDWHSVSDAEYESVNLLPPWKYYGEEGLSFDFDRASGETSWSDDFHYGHQFRFYRLKPGDKERAEAEANTAAAAMRAEWDKIPEPSRD